MARVDTGSAELPESRVVSEGQDACRFKWPIPLLNTMVTSGPELQLRAMFSSMALLQHNVSLKCYHFRTS